MAQLYQFKGHSMPLAESACLLDAVYWIAGKIPPLAPKYKDFFQDQIAKIDQEKISEAKTALCVHLMQGRLNAWSVPFGDKVIIPEINAEGDLMERLIASHRAMAVPVPSEDWVLSNIEWENDILRKPLPYTLDASGDGYMSICVSVKELLTIWSAPLESSDVVVERIADVSNNKLITSREHALRDELKELFAVAWAKPANNRECWDLVRKIDPLEKETVIQEVVHHGNDLDKCKILWRSPNGVERTMKRTSFNNLMSNFRK